MKELKNKLTEEEFNRFIRAIFFIRNSKLNIYYTLKYFENPKPSDFIHESFVWRNTLEGHEYWLDIYLKLQHYSDFEFIIELEKSNRNRRK